MNALRLLPAGLLASACLALPAAAPAQEPAGKPRVSFEAKTLPANDVETKILGVIEDVFANQRRGSMSVPTHDGRILRVLAESIGAKHVVELGTSVGYSGLWFSLALKATGGKLTTYEIDKDRAAKARANFARAGVGDIITIVEGDAHVEVTKLKEPIDLLFLDADKEGYVDYLNKLLPLVKPGGLIVAHNMVERMAHPPYLQAITTNPALETVYINLSESGIGVTLKKR
ncbi:MAG: hypothetical protein FJ221_18300 [Lentisphaerae bacterium]|nr:hypothetical protein [Lentisphaerota bacterium]